MAIVTEKLRNKLHGMQRVRAEAAARRFLAGHNLMPRIEAMGGMGAHGVSLVDYAVLYAQVMRLKPRYMLECGTGKSTHILAQAMADHCLDAHGGDIRLVSMEHQEKWHTEAVNNFPEEFKSFTDIVYSPEDWWQYSFVRGTVYKEVPELPYDLVFVDGPDHYGACNMDFIRVVAGSDKPVRGLVDNRKLNMLAYAALLGRDKVQGYRCGPNTVAPVTKHDLVRHPGKEGVARQYLANIAQKSVLPF